MARWILLALVSGAGTYAIFFHELGGKPFSGHFSDVWRSPAMQEKLRMVERGIGSPWRFASPPPPPPATKPRPRVSRGAPTASNAHGTHDEADRKSLDALVHRLQKR